MAEGVIKKILAAELQLLILDDNIEVYPVTATSAVFDPKTNQSLDDILSSINTRIIQAAASGGGGGTISIAGLTYIWAFAGFKNDSEAIADIEEKANIRGIPSGWQESSNVDLQDGEMLYMTTARKQGDKWLTWTDGHIWSTPVRLGSSGTTSGTGSDGLGYNYIYCRTSTGLMPLFNVSVDFTELINRVELASTLGEGILVQKIEDNVFYEPSMDPTDVWYDHPDGVTATIPYEWILVYLGNEKDGWTPLTPLPILWSKYGVNGQDGDGVEYVFCAVSEGKDAPTIVKNNTITGTVNGNNVTIDINTISTNNDYLQDDFIPEDWSDEPVQVDLDNPRLYVSIRKKKWVADEEKSKWGLFTEPKIWTEIPIIKAGADRLSLDWSNNNVNVVQGETGQALIDATTNYLSVKIGSTPIPYTEELPAQGLGYTLTISESSYYKAKLTSISLETDSSVLIPMGGIQLTELSTNARNFAVSVTVKVKYNEDSNDIYTLIASFNVNVKDEVYEIIASPTGFNLSAIDTKSLEPLTVRVQRRNSTLATRFLTQAEITSLGTLQYTYKPSGAIITLSGTSQETEFTIPCDTDNALSGCRQIYLEFNSNARGYEDSETIMIARDGNTGDEGNGIEYIFYLADGDIDWSNHDDNPENLEVNQNPEFRPTNWTDDLQEVTEYNPVQYVSVRRFKRQNDGTKAWGKFEKPVVYNRWVPSPYSMSISNDSVIIDDNTDSITLANASFCLLHIFSGQDEITTNSDYTFEVTPLANNGANSIFNLYQASKNEISTINNFQLIQGNDGTYKSFGESIPITGTDSNTNGGIAFYITKKEDANLQINSYGIQYKLDIYKSGSMVASLYKVLPIKVANFSADGTIYKLNITNDTWTYDGDTNILVSTTTSTVTVAKIKGATAELQTFSIGKDAPGNSPTGLYVKTNLVGTSETNLTEKEINAITSYSVSSHSLELYFNGILVDAETIDCRKDGKKGDSGLSYYLTCDNDNIIIDLDTTNNTDIQAVSTYNLLLWKSGEKIQYSTENELEYYVTVPDYSELRHYLNIANQRSLSSYFQIIKDCTLTEGSFLATATAEIKGEIVASKIINVIIKLLKGTGVSYKLMVSPNTLLYEYDTANTIYTPIGGRPDYTPTDLSVTVVKISEGKAINIEESKLGDHNLVLVKPTEELYPYSSSGYDFTLKLEGTIVDIEHVDCIVQGTNGINGKNGDTLLSNANMYIDLSDPNGPSLNINANFYAKDTLNYCYLYWGDITLNIRLALVRAPLSTLVTVTIKIPYLYIASSFDKYSSGVICTKSTSTGTLTFYNSSDGWGTCTHITLVTLSMSGVTDTKVIYRTGTEGYYFDTTSSHFISTFSKAENIHPLVTANNLDLFEVLYSKQMGDGTTNYNIPYEVQVFDTTSSISIWEIPAAIILEGNIIPKDGFTVVNDNRVNGIGNVTFKSFSKSLNTTTDTPWNNGQPEPVIKVCTVLCYEWSLYYNKEIPAIPNLDYVISFYIRLKENTDISILPYVRVELEASEDSDQHHDGEVTTEWKRFFIKAHNSTGSKVRLVGGARTSDYSNLLEVVTFEIGGFQITRGSDLAPWAPYSGETMSVLLLTSKEFNSTVSLVTAHETSISLISLLATLIQMTVNKAGLTVTDTGTTFTGDVNATNFNVCDSQNRAVMLVLVATQELTLDNSSKIAIGEPYIKLNTYNDNGTITSKYVGLYNLKDSTATDRLTYTTTTYLGVPTSAIDKTNPKIDSSRSYYTLISKIKLDGIGVTNINIDNTNYPIYNNLVWVQANSASATVSDQQVSCTGNYVSNPFILTTKCKTLSLPNYYVVENDIIYPITKLTYGDRILIDNVNTMLPIENYWVCGVCAIESAIGTASWLRYFAGSFTGVMSGQSDKGLTTITGYFKRVNTIGESNFPLFIENL